MNKILSLKKVSKNIEKQLISSNWDNVEHDVLFNDQKLDYLLKYNDIPLAGIKVSINKKITPRMIKLFINKHQALNIPVLMMSNGTNLIIYYADKCNYEIKKLSSLPMQKDLIDNYFINDSQNYNYIYIFITFLILILGGGFVYTKYELFKQKKEFDIHVLKLEYEEELKEKYNSCLQSTISLNDVSTLEAYEKNLNDYLQEKYNVSILYKELSDDYSYTYRPDIIYYAASTIKTIDALYIYNQALSNPDFLKNTITYTKGYAYTDSQGMAQHKYGDKVSLKDLVKYLIMYSDNSAHMMLVDYLGMDKLKAYAHELGAKNAFSGNDYFGNISVYDAEKYLEELYGIITGNMELTDELKNYFINSIHNDLKLETVNIEAATKYGYYGSYFHNIGIILDKQPYLVVILTKEGKNDFDAKIRDINMQIYKLHKIYQDQKKEQCYSDVYGESNGI